jgi:hypothetical protein
MAGFRLVVLLLAGGTEEEEIEVGGLVGIAPLEGILVGQCVGCARGLRGDAGVSERGD